MLLIFIFLHCGLDYVILFVFSHIRILPLNLFFEKLQQKKGKWVLFKKGFYSYKVAYFENLKISTAECSSMCTKKTE